jgi:anaerobic C4-dicarboxylate transporter DcuA
MAVCVPSTLCGVVVGAIVMTFWGKPLDQDPEYRRRLEAGELDEPADAVGEEKARSRRDQIGSVVVFLLAAVAIVLFGMVPGLRPTYPSGVEETTLEALSMPQIIQIVMYSAAAVMMLAFGARPEVAVKTRVATAGVIAVVSIVGLGWMGNCFFEGNRTTIVAALADTVTAQPWLFAVALFALSVLLFSQASTVAALMPLGLSLGLAPATLVASFPAVNGYFFLPTYGTIVTAVAFDRTGTTRIGRYVLNHSFMLPGMISTVVALAVGAVVARWVVVAG